MRQLFPSQQENEKIYLVVREHWARLLFKLLVWFMFLLALVYFNNFIANTAPSLLQDQAGIVTALFIKVYEMFLVLSLFVIWLLHYLNIQIITSIRIVDIYQIGLFSHTVSELHIDKIEDVTSETDGVFGTMFDFGMVFIQTAGTKERFEFSHVPHPAQIEKAILDLYEKNSNFAKEASESAPKT